MEFSVGLMLIALGTATVAGRLWRIVETTADEAAPTTNTGLIRNR